MNGLRTGSMFSGIGLLDYGLTLAGFEHAWLCEADEWRRGILARRWPGIPVHDDVRAIGADTVRRVDVIAGGFPCKGASTAGKRTGFDHPETVLWREMARAVGELRPRYVLVENVANILVLRDGALWGEVLGTLAALGYDTVWDCLPAAAVGAPHLRDRVFAVAADTARDERPQEHAGDDSVAGQRTAIGRWAEQPSGTGGHAAPTGGRLPGAHAADRRTASKDGRPASDAGRERGELRRGPGQVAGASGHAEGEAPQRQRPRDAAGSAGEDAADAPLERWEPSEHAAQQPGVQRDARRGVGVDWGSYAPAIRRWEAVHGPAPEPLVRRVDDRGAARVERSRLSALGDGVQVQIGRIAGEYIAGLERERLMREAA